MSNFPMEMSDFSWQHQKYARPEIYVVTLVLLRLYTEKEKYNEETPKDSSISRYVS